jgi:formylglycine-generating enzyme required for sulfatase activity
VLVGRNGTLKITDFGISDTQARQALEEARMASATGVSCTTPSLVRWANTPMYASPQQRRGEDPHPADDVHALGVMLYQMLLRDLNLELGVDMWSDLEEQYVCQELLDLLSRAVAARVDRRFPSAAELAEALARLPEKLIVKPDVISVPDQEKRLYQEIDRLVEDARAKNEVASQHLERREWKAAVATLESIFHPVMRDEDLYTRAIQHRDGKRFINGLGMEFVIVPAGTSWMGGQDGNCGGNQVAIDRDFFIGVYPVTQEEWQKVMGANPSHFRKGGAGADKLSGVSDADLKRFPVESVSWNDCQVFIKKLNESLKETGWMYRLPREAEWEYACRGAANTQALSGWNFYLRAPTNTLSAQQANFSDSALGRTCRVGLYEANALGIFDLHGNVWEWCEDAWDGSNRVLRGGSWVHAAELCRAAYRRRNSPPNSFSHLGLRLARVPSGK